MDKARLGLFGATSLVGECLSPLLVESGWHVVAFSRRPDVTKDTDVEWRQIESPDSINPARSMVEKEGERGASNVVGTISSWICLAPIWVLPDYFELLEAYGVKRIVALSSTSRFTKSDSHDPAEQELANKFATGEAKLQRWAESKGIDWVIIRPTLIYGLGLDSNITQIASFIRRWKCFPLLGASKGLRQPIYVEDVAKVCIAATASKQPRNRAYNLSGGEILNYREMVARVFASMGERPVFVPLPRWIFVFGIRALHSLSWFRHLSLAMVDRMNKDMVFDHSEVRDDFKVYPRNFTLEEKDLPE